MIEKGEKIYHHDNAIEIRHPLINAPLAASLAYPTFSVNRLQNEIMLLMVAQFSWTSLYQLNKIVSAHVSAVVSAVVSAISMLSTHKHVAPENTSHRMNVNIEKSNDQPVTLDLINELASHTDQPVH
ncbi:hypothetical protein HELRODRAFT_168311 [Helobdella robusta]|uniref:Uncharacterized protein n=1 Tax=Helobdella robusta TaxID=6412 RepID=T1F0F3_HELRO|nr:hypothetical protein HELRODRAFT_168311 [Helobdella robusta]ESO09340.1 hypothetical protein HELRODRAFT_168311 [Helobdella robusta]